VDNVGTLGGRVESVDWQGGRVEGKERLRDPIRTSVYDNHSNSMKITLQDHISLWNTASGTTWSKRWTYRVFSMDTHRN